MSEKMLFPLWSGAPPLVLASQSATRRAMLETAGLPVEPVSPDIDERALETAATSSGINANEVAIVLAREKAMAVSARMPGRTVIGADQTLTLGSRRFHKPASLLQAREKLLALRGRTHVLHSAVVVAQDGLVLWGEVDEARLTMRDFSEAFLDEYLDAAGDTVLTSVGSYRIEGLGQHLFERIEGSHATILGMPILPLLDFLRREGALTP
jgi:septum formation protein